MKNINYDDFNILKEFYLLWKTEKLKKSNKVNTKTRNKILIVDTGLVGDTLATLKPLSLYLKSKNKKTDIIVSSPLKTLIEKMHGIDKVFTAKSVYKRAIESEREETILADNYSKIIVLRISKDSYNIIRSLKFNSIETYYSKFLKYSINLVKSIFLRKVPKQWIDFNFEVLGIKKPKKQIKFNDIFRFKDKDYESINRFQFIKDKREKVLIHTGSGWDSKLWGIEKWIKLIKDINKIGDFQLIFIGNTDEEEKTFKTIEKEIDFKVFSVINKVDLKELALLMEKSDYFIGVDSGPRNLANLVGLRSITLLSPAAPNTFMPQNKDDIAIDNPTFFTLGLFSINTHKIDEISEEEVLDSFRKIAKIH